MPFGWHCSGLEMALGEAGNGANRREEEEEEKKIAKMYLCECEGLLGFNLCSKMGQSVGKGTEEERD